jgi:uncharacterized membrane protein
MAGELEVLGGDEPLAQHIRRHAYDRTIMLADGVFAIAITLLALELRPPPHWNGDLYGLLESTWRSLFAYVFGFAIIGASWVAHRSLFSRIRRVDGPLTALALVHLCLVAITPAVAELVAMAGPAKAMKVYFILIVAIGAVQAFLWGYAAFVSRLVDASLGLAERRLIQLQLVVPPVMFLALLLARLSGSYESAAMPVILGGFALMMLVRRRLRRSVKLRSLAEANLASRDPA